MKDQDIYFFKQLLTEQLNALLGQADLTVRGLIDNNERSADTLDRASFESERGFMLRIRDRESKLIRKIQRAGRTARLMKGKLIILITKDTLDEIFYYASMAKEKRMYKAIDSIKKQMDNGKPLNSESKQKKLF